MVKGSSIWEQNKQPSSDPIFASMRHLTLALAALAPWAVLAQNNSPGAPQTAPIVIEGATVHVGDGQVFAPGYVVFAGGKITAVGAGAPAQAPAGATRIAAQGKHLYPGLVLVNNTIGLDEVGAVRATHDYAEVGDASPEVLAVTAYNAASELVETARANGVLTAMVTPSAGGSNLAPGRAGLVQLDAWTTDGAVLRRSVGVMLAIPPRYANTGWWAEPGASVVNEGRTQGLAKLRQLLADARSYCQAPKSSRPYNERLEAFRNAFAGTEAVYIDAPNAREILEAVQLARSYGFARVVVLADASAVRVADFLAKERVPVILKRIHSLPSRGDAPYDEVFAAPARLRAAGVEVALDISGDMEPMHARNLGLMAGTATGYGLTEEQALEAVTLAPARILGVAEQLGSLAVGKDATLFVADGSFADIAHGKVRQAFIQGRNVDLNTRQKDLYRKYAGRYGQAVDRNP